MDIAVNANCHRVVLLTYRSRGYLLVFRLRVKRLAEKWFKFSDEHVNMPHGKDGLCHTSVIWLLSAITDKRRYFRTVQINYSTTERVAY